MDSNSKQIKIGNYLIGNTIGKGNSAVVKVATHSLTKHKVAIKIFDKSVLDTDKQLRLKREIESMKHLKKHQNIIKLYEIMETNKLICLVTEYASNGELYDYIIHKKRLSEREAKNIFGQIISAVNFCHLNRIVHRDLKVENLLLDSNWRIKLADFGFSSPFNPNELLDIYCGSPPYCAPELFLAKRYDGTKVDIWSLGVILYVLVCGYLPFEASQFSVLRSQVINGSFKLPFFLSEDCKNLINAMLMVDPNKRINLDDIIKHKWLNSDKNSINYDHLESSILSRDFGHLIDKIENISILENSPNEEILNELAKRYDLDKNKIIESISNNEFDSYSGIYYLTEASLYQNKAQEQVYNIQQQQQQFTISQNNYLNLIPNSFNQDGYKITKSKFEMLETFNENAQSDEADENLKPIEELGRDYLTRYNAIRRHTIATNSEGINEDNSAQNLNQILDFGQSLNSNFNLPNINSEHFNLAQEYQTIQLEHNPRKHSYFNNYEQNSKCIKSNHESNAKNEKNDINYLQPPISNTGRRASDGGSNISLFNHLYHLKTQLCYNPIIASNNSLASENGTLSTINLENVDGLDFNVENYKRQSRGSITSGTPVANLLLNRSSDEEENQSNDVNNNHLPSNSFKKRPSFSKGSRHEPYMDAQTQNDMKQQPIYTRQRDREYSFSGCSSIYSNNSQDQNYLQNKVSSTRSKIHRASDTNHQELLNANRSHLERIYNQSINKTKVKMSLNKELKILQQENLEHPCLPLIQNEQFNFQLNPVYHEALNDFHQNETSNYTERTEPSYNDINDLQQQTNMLNKNLQIIQEEQTNEVHMLTESIEQQQHSLIAQCFRKSYEHLMNQSPQKHNLITQ
ncbi:unnamed protein product [Brachionus calyciflorus]|uniref:non-specific serine/threonine protein kinase n=1 Tax=Brachionus calyciflorus TaxID=104777 RepID=A0A813U2I8_9BILA|nr:unnamed protein product [Brachionus calyciflorus]